jgi:hypothetical protein
MRRFNTGWVIEAETVATAGLGIGADTSMGTGATLAQADKVAAADRLTTILRIDMISPLARHLVATFDRTNAT